MLGRPATTAELAQAAGASEEEAAAADRLATALTPLPLEAAEPPAAEDAFAESENRMLLTSCIARLRERDRAIVHLRFYAGLSQREIGRALGISQVQVSRSLARSLERCRRQLEPRENTPRNGVTNVVVPAQESYTQRDAAGRATG